MFPHVARGGDRRPAGRSEVPSRAAVVTRCLNSMCRPYEAVRSTYYSLSISMPP